MHFSMYLPLKKDFSPAILPPSSVPCLATILGLTKLSLRVQVVVSQMPTLKLLASYFHSSVYRLTVLLRNKYHF